MVVIGSSCAGKSAFAKRLAAQRGCAHIELDELHWGADWTPKPRDEFLRLAREAAAGDCWVASGNYSVVREVLWPRATTIVWLDLALRTVLWRGLRRTLRRAFTREPLFHGNRESFRRSFLSRESILWWIVSTFGRRRRDFQALREGDAYPHLAWLHVSSPRAADALLHTLMQGERTA